ncbi:MAG: glycosyltransferase family 39 protein [Nitrososphaerales archaeon]
MLKKENLKEHRFFFYFLILMLSLTLLWLDKPLGSLIFDEAYYVNAARVIAGVTPPKESQYSNSPLGKDPNIEHPFLGKVIISLFIKSFGDNAFSWRIPSVIFSLIALIFFYFLAFRLFKSSRMALYSSIILGLDNLFFVHSRIATLDIFMLSFIIMGFYFFLSRKYIPSGIALALAFLFKEQSILAIFVVIIYIGFNYLFSKEFESLKALWLFLVGLALGYFPLAYFLTPIFTNFQNPLEHVEYMYNYVGALVRQGSPVGIESYPWQWILNQVEIPYLKVDGEVFAGEKSLGKVTLIYFNGAMNPSIIYLTPIALSYTLLEFIKGKRDSHLFLLLWFFVTYLPYFPLALLANRIMYLFYFLNTLPSLALALGLTFLDERIPKSISLAYLFSVALGFLALFPFKSIPS